jgi:hypothetical protein
LLEDGLQLTQGHPSWLAPVLKVERESKIDYPLIVAGVARGKKKAVLDGRGRDKWVNTTDLQPLGFELSDDTTSSGCFFTLQWKNVES